MAFRRVFKNPNDFEYIFARSINDAKETLTENQFDLIICDFFLTDGTAFDILPYPGTPFIILSGNKEDELVENAKKQGVADFILKDKNCQYLEDIYSNLERYINNNSPVYKKQVSSNLMVFNYDRLKEKYHENPAFANELLAIYLKENPKGIQELTNAIQTNDWNNAQLAIHKMKSGYRELGLIKCYDLCESLYFHLAKPAGNSEQIQGQFKELVNLSNISYDLIKEKLSLQ